MKTNMPGFELRDVTKTYRSWGIKVEALKKVNLEFNGGDFIAIAGPSGSGKTTLLNILGCLDVPTSGDVVIDGQLINQKYEKNKRLLRRDKIGFIFQNANLIPVINVYENVEYPLLLMRTSSKERKELVEKALIEVGLQDRMKHFPNTLSGGERQRVSIARALVKRPKLVLADEPTANLDSSTAHKTIELMRRLNDEEKIAFCFSTHDSRILDIAVKIYHLTDGEIKV